MTTIGPNGPELPPEPSDESLVERVVQRDVAAFTALYDRYAQMVYATAVHVVGRQDAEEVVQDVFLRLWHKADQFDANRGSFRSWFMTIARNHMMDELKRRGQEERLLVARRIEQSLDQAAAPSADMIDETWPQERTGQLLQALRGLPVEQRQAIILAYFGGLSQSAIAQELDWPLGTVKKRIRLGLQKLRAFFILRQQGIQPQDELAHTGEE